MTRLAAGLLLVAAALRVSAQDPPPVETMAIADYELALDEMAAALESGDTASAARRAEGLETRAITFEEETVTPDRGLLAAVKSATTPARARAVARRVRAVAAELGPARAAVPDPDHGLVERLRARGRIEAGGRIPPPAVPALSIPERILQALDRVRTKIGELIDKVLDWLIKLWPQRAGGGESTGTVSLTLVVVAAALCVLVILALRTARRSRAVPMPAEARRATASADEDPLSRETDEWERYARELAAAGRRREAVRAWYHAVLSTLFRAGLLEPRKGRTNWEHVASLPPELGWRPSFVEITRAFEREWYGRDDSTPDALAQCARLAGRIRHSLRTGATA